MSSDDPISILPKQEQGLDHSKLVGTAARVRAISPQFGWPSLLFFLLGPIPSTPTTHENELIKKAVGVVIVLASIALRLATRGYHRKNGFVINGPYRYIRNPVEVGAVGGILGAGLILDLPYWYIAVVVILAMAFLSFASLAYEKILLEKLKENYFRYTRRVKRWFPSFLPGVNRVNRDYSLWAAFREERDSLFYFIAWVGVYALRSHFLSQINWW